jgi:glycine/D-amino acid oxidase-like deaminating enzyme
LGVASTHSCLRTFLVASGKIVTIITRDLCQQTSYGNASEMLHAKVAKKLRVHFSPHASKFQFGAKLAAAMPSTAMNRVRELFGLRPCQSEYIKYCFKGIRDIVDELKAEMACQGFDKRKAVYASRSGEITFVDDKARFVNTNMFNTSLVALLRQKGACIYTGMTVDGIRSTTGAWEVAYTNTTTRVTRVMTSPKLVVACGLDTHTFLSAHGIAMPRYTPLYAPGYSFTFNLGDISTLNTRPVKSSKCLVFQSNQGPLFCRIYKENQISGVTLRIGGGVCNPTFTRGEVDTRVREDEYKPIFDEIKVCLPRILRVFGLYMARGRREYTMDVDFDSKIAKNNVEIWKGVREFNARDPTRGYCEEVAPGLYVACASGSNGYVHSFGNGRRLSEIL